MLDLAFLYAGVFLFMLDLVFVHAGAFLAVLNLAFLFLDFPCHDA